MFVYNGATGPWSTSATANTPDCFAAIRQASQAVLLSALWLIGKAAAATSITGIVVRGRRWTTVGSGGTAVTMSPRWIGPTMLSSVVDKTSAITPGTTGGATALVAGFPSVGGGGWTARSDMAMVRLEGGSADELALYSETAGTVALSYEADLECEE